MISFDSFIVFAEFRVGGISIRGRVVLVLRFFFRGLEGVLVGLDLLLVFGAFCFFIWIVRAFIRWFFRMFRAVSRL